MYAPLALWRETARERAMSAKTGGIVAFDREAMRLQFRTFASVPARFPARCDPVHDEPGNVHLIRFARQERVSNVPDDP